MKQSITTKLIAIQAIITPASIVFAHDGHGASTLGTSHWRASDAFGFMVLAVIIVLTLWLSRGRK
jgi:hypothetical protein